MESRKCEDCTRGAQTCLGIKLEGRMRAKQAVVVGASVLAACLLWAGRRAVADPVEGRVVRGEASVDVGDRIRVRLVSTDVERGFIDFSREG